MARILIVDDEKSIRTSLEQFLIEAGHEANTAADAESAFLSLENNEVDIVVTDIILPQNSGTDLFRRINASFPKIKVILMTGEPNLSSAMAAIRLGAFDYLTKPVRKEQICQAVNKAVHEKNLEEENRKLKDEVIFYKENVDRLVQEQTTELLDRQKQLTNDYNRLLTVFDALPEFVYVQAPDYSIRFSNKAFRSLFGPTEDRPCYQVVKDRDRPCDDCPTFRVFETGQTEHWQWHRENGRSYMVHDVLFTDQDGTDVVLEIGIDITDQKQAEEKLRESEELNRVTLTNITDAVLITDDLGKFTFVCPNVTYLFGYTSQEVEEIGNAEKLIGPGLFRLENLKEQGTLSNIEWQITDKNGKQHFILATIKNVSIKGGTVLYSLRDITERKKAEEELKTQALRLDEANVALKVLLDHKEQEKNNLELMIQNNVAKLVKPFLEKLKSTKLSDQQRGYLNTMEANLDEVISPFLVKLTTEVDALSPKEIEVAHLIKQGKTSKEIAQLLNSSVETVNHHRQNIRSKLGLANQKTNLRTRLQSLLKD